MVVLDARAAEHADGRAQAVQAIGRRLELCHNSHQSPRLLPVRRI